MITLFYLRFTVFKSHVMSQDDITLKGEVSFERKYQDTHKVDTSSHSGSQFPPTKKNNTTFDL